MSIPFELLLNRFRRKKERSLSTFSFQIKLLHSRYVYSDKCTITPLRYYIRSKSQLLKPISHMFTSTKKELFFLHNKRWEKMHLLSYFINYLKLWLVDWCNLWRRHCDFCSVTYWVFLHMEYVKYRLPLLGVWTWQVQFWSSDVWGKEGAAAQSKFRTADSTILSLESMH